MKKIPERKSSKKSPHTKVIYCRSSINKTVINWSTSKQWERQKKTPSGLDYPLQQCMLWSITSHLPTCNLTKWRWHIKLIFTTALSDHRENIRKLHDHCAFYQFTDDIFSICCKCSSMCCCVWDSTISVGFYLTVVLKFFEGTNMGKNDPSDTTLPFLKNPKPLKRNYKVLSNTQLKESQKWK